MKRFLLYGHGGAYNHGAEAIVQTTIKIIREKHKGAYIALSSHFPEQDREFGLDIDEFFSPVPDIWEAEKRADSLVEKELLAKEMYVDALNFMTPDTVYLSVGGDNFCYQNWHRLAVFQYEVVRKKAKSILWGCSVEPSMITPDMAHVLNSYTHILARESNTYNALIEGGINTDIQLIPDPAFLLEPVPTEFPDDFQTGRIVGINISPLVMRRESTPGILKENIQNLMNYILSETDMKIALIPHVTMPMDNDYGVLCELARSFSSDIRSRVWLVGEKKSATELKTIISKCDILLCARTHASIAAYSLGIPVMVIGYSVKSVGIAKDLGMSEFVLDIGNIKSSCAIVDMFKLLYEKSDAIKSIMKESCKGYTEKLKEYFKYI